MSRPLVASGIYLLGMAAYVYVLVERDVGGGNDIASALILVMLVLLHVGTGIGVAQWWAVLLPLVAVALAMPAGYPDEYRYHEPLPIWIGVAWISPAGMFLIAIGVAIARRTRLGGRWASGSASSRRSSGRSRTT